MLLSSSLETEYYYLQQIKDKDNIEKFKIKFFINFLIFFPLFLRSVCATMQRVNCHVVHKNDIKDYL